MAPFSSKASAACPSKNSFPGKTKALTPGASNTWRKWSWALAEPWRVTEVPTTITGFSSKGCTVKDIHSKKLFKAEGIERLCSEVAITTPSAASILATSDFSGSWLLRSFDSLNIGKPFSSITSNSTWLAKCCAIKLTNFSVGESLELVPLIPIIFIKIPPLRP